MGGVTSPLRLELSLSGLVPSSRRPLASHVMCHLARPPFFVELSVGVRRSGMAKLSDIVRRRGRGRPAIIVPLGSMSNHRIRTSRGFPYRMDELAS